MKTLAIAVALLNPFACDEVADRAPVTERAPTPVKSPGAPPPATLACSLCTEEPRCENGQWICRVPGAVFACIPDPPRVCQ